MGQYPQDPDGDMVPILEASLEAAMARHPAGKGMTMVEALTAKDRCDRCGAQAYFRIIKPFRDATDSKISRPSLDFCAHHWRNFEPTMSKQGWIIATAMELEGTPS